MASGNEKDFGVGNIDSWIRSNLFDVIPMAAAVIDQEYNLVLANRAFEQMFGAWQKKKCYTVYKDRTSICPDCRGSTAFKDGVARINQEMGYNKNGRLTRYVKHTVPIIDKEGNIPFLLEMATDITETELIRREHQLLFDQVPCYILVINRDFRIVRTNKKLKEMFGNIEGEFCYKAFRGEDDPCSYCLARQTFEDGQMHFGHSEVKEKTGDRVQLHVTYVPLDLADGKFDLVMEMAVDVTHMMDLEAKLRATHAVMQSMIAKSIDSIIAVDENGDITIFNPAARTLFKIDDNRKVSKEELTAMLPEYFIDRVARGDEHLYFPETEVRNIDGDTLPVRLAGTKLVVDNRSLGVAVWIQDIRELRQLEAEKLEAERLAAVGQTVAGLAHGVKNLITGLEGGMYMLSSGMNKGDFERAGKGIEMLDRNIVRVASFVTEFLSFSKGRKITVQLSSPTDIAHEVVDMYYKKAKELNVELIKEFSTDILPAPMDSESMHECLTNLVGNAIDACRMSDNKNGCRVRVRTFEKNETIVYEIVDNGCGMDYEVKQKVFTTFFTTKGLGGTGLGLLMTKKIIQEHGGTIDLESEAEKGSTFRITLPRSRLPQLVEPGTIEA